MFQGSEFHNLQKVGFLEQGVRQNKWNGNIDGIVAQVSDQFLGAALFGAQQGDQLPSNAAIKTMKGVCQRGKQIGCLEALSYLPMCFCKVGQLRLQSVSTGRPTHASAP